MTDKNLSLRDLRRLAYGSTPTPEGEFSKRLLAAFDQRDDENVCPDCDTEFLGVPTEDGKRKCRVCLCVWQREAKP